MSRIRRIDYNKDLVKVVVVNKPYINIRSIAINN